MATRESEVKFSFTAISLGCRPVIVQESSELFILLKITNTVKSAYPMTVLV